MTSTYTKHAKPIIVVPNCEPMGEPVPRPMGGAGKKKAARRHSPVRNVMRARAVRDDSDDEDIPIAAPRVELRPIEDFNALSDEEKSESFWKTITSFGWMNATDGRPNIHAIQNIIAGMCPERREHFKMSYFNAYDVMQMRLMADGMFERNGIVSIVEQAKIISHVIAMGSQQYNVLIDDPAIYQFFIEQGDCQSFDAILPHDMQH